MPKDRLNLTLPKDLSFQVSKFEAARHTLNGDERIRLLKEALKDAESSVGTKEIIKTLLAASIALQELKNRYLSGDVASIEVHEINFLLNPNIQAICPPLYKEASELKSILMRSFEKKLDLEEEIGEEQIVARFQELFAKLEKLKQLTELMEFAFRGNNKDAFQNEISEFMLECISPHEYFLYCSFQSQMEKPLKETYIMGLDIIGQQIRGTIRDVQMIIAKNKNLFSEVSQDLKELYKKLLGFIPQKIAESSKHLEPTSDPDSPTDDQNHESDIEVMSLTESQVTSPYSDSSESRNYSLPMQLTSHSPTISPTPSPITKNLARSNSPNYSLFRPITPSREEKDSIESTSVGFSK